MGYEFFLDMRFAGNFEMDWRKWLFYLLLRAPAKRERGLRGIRAMNYGDELKG